MNENEGFKPKYYVPKDTREPIIVDSTKPVASTKDNDDESDEGYVEIIKNHIILRRQAEAARGPGAEAPGTEDTGSVPATARGLQYGS